MDGQVKEGHQLLEFLHEGSGALELGAGDGDREG
jgi:hypothetical protein